MTPNDMTHTAEALARLAKEPSPMAKALSAIPRQPKDRKNAHGGYDYLSEEAVKVACHKGLIAAGIALEGVQLEILSDCMVKAKQGESNMVKIRCTLTICGKRYEGLGSGMDYGDKAMLKAQTAAYREALKLAFCIGTGLDPEADEETPGDAPARAPQTAAPVPAPKPAQAPAAPLPRPAARPAPRPAQPQQQALPAAPPRPVQPATAQSSGMQVTGGITPAQITRLVGLRKVLGMTSDELRSMCSSILGAQKPAGELTQPEAARFIEALEQLVDNAPESDGGV